MIRLPTICVLCIGLIGDLSAQALPRSRFADSSAAQIMQHAGIHSNDQAIQDVLRQRSTTVLSKRIDEIADSLVARAIRPDELPSGDGTELTVGAVNAIISSGLTNGGGKPFAGALDRLIRIDKSATNKFIRARALSGLLSVGERTKALTYLSEVAISADPSAVAAVRSLVIDCDGRSGWIGGPTPTIEERGQSRRILLDLATNQRARNSDAAEALRRWLLSPSSKG